MLSPQAGGNVAGAVGAIFLMPGAGGAVGHAEQVGEHLAVDGADQASHAPLRRVRVLGMPSLRSLLVVATAPSASLAAGPTDPGLHPLAPPPTHPSVTHPSVAAHHLLDRPLEAPAHTATGLAGLVLFFIPFLAGSLGGHRRYPEAEIRELAEELREEATA